MKPYNPAGGQGRGGGALSGTGESLKLGLEAGSGGAVVLHCQGRLVFQGEARTLCAVVADVLPLARRMVVDLSGVEAVDSAGLGELVLTHLWAEAAGFELKFASPRRAIQQLFELTNLVSVFDLYSSVPEAMAAMRQEDVHSA